MKYNYNTAIDFIFKYEGGYVNHPKDPGGPTNRGITLATARSFWKKNATAEDVKAMPKSVAEDIYRKQYADKVNFDNLPSGLDLVAFDAGVLSGPGRANQWIKDCKTVEEYQNKRLAFYKSLATWPTFGKGWTARINAGTKLANSLPKAEVKPTSNTNMTIGTAGAVIVAGGAASQVPPHWYDQFLQPHALMIGAGIFTATIAILYFVYRRYKEYKATIAAKATIDNLNKPISKKSIGRAI